MVNHKKYTDFVQTGRNETHVIFQCPVIGCLKPIVYVPLNDSKQKSSRCLKHNKKHHSPGVKQALSHPEPGDVCTPVEPTGSTTSSCDGVSRPTLEDAIETLKKQSQEAERRHKELLDEFRTAQCTLNGFVAMVAREMNITPPDVVTVSATLPKKLEFHNRRISSLQCQNQLFSNQKQVDDKEIFKLKRKISELQRKNTELQQKPQEIKVEVRYRPEYKALHEFCKDEGARKRMRVALHPDKLQGMSDTTTKAAETIRNSLGL
jgi:hypothetical protein